MKILFTIDSLISGGKQRRFVELLKKINLFEDIDCMVICFDRDVHYKEIFDLDLEIKFLIRKNKNFFSSLNKFYKIAKAYAPDIIHSWDTFSTLHAIPISVFSPIKLITSKISDTPNNYNKFSKDGFYSEICFKFSDLVLSNSYAGLNAYNVSRHKSEVIHNGFNFDRLNGIKPYSFIKNSLNLHEESIIITMVARFSADKDYEVFLEAANKNKNENIIFLCVGDGILKEDLEKKYKNKSILFLGDRDDVESLINISDIGVLMTKGEGISNAIMEFMAFKKPIIASNVGGNSELIENKVSGILIDSNDATSLMHAIKYLLDNPIHAKEIGINAYNQIKTKFSIDKMVNEFYKKYKRIIER